MSTFLIRSATSQSSSYPIVLTRLGGPRSRPKSHLKFVEVPGITTSNNAMFQLRFVTFMCFCVFTSKAKFTHPPTFLNIAASVVADYIDKQLE